MEAPQGCYVYRILVDGSVRYIGKGKRQRVFHHEKTARRLNERRAEGEKVQALSFHNRLAKAIRNGAEIAYEFAAGGLDDEAALDLEASEMARFGADQLWNVRMERQPYVWPAASEFMRRPEQRARISSLSKRLWRDPKTRPRMMAAAARKWDDPEMRAKHRANVLASITDEKRAAFGNRVRESWKNPISRAYRLAKFQEGVAERFAGSLTQRVLTALRENPGQTVAELGALLGSDRVNRCLFKLKKRGLVVHDGRKYGFYYPAGAASAPSGSVENPQCQTRSIS